MGEDQVQCSDAWGAPVEEDPWDTWDKVKEMKGFPGGLIAFLQTSTDHEGCGFERPTVVQAYAWPVLQSGRDLVGVAKTGSGKTLAFLLPGFIKLRKLKRKGEVDSAKGPIVLALTPTRELCHQIYSDAEKFGKPVQINAACAYGGASKKDQEWKIKEGPDVLIATPGRLKDFVDSWVVKLDQVRYAVLDEADRMLDMGFEPQIREIMDNVTTDRQTSMFTATWPKECIKLAERYIKEPTKVQIGSDEITTNKNITQHIEVVEDEKDKTPALMKILKSLGWEGTCLVFCNTKRKCRDLCYELCQDRRSGFNAVELHGDLDQRQRDDALDKFRKGEARVLCATDVAARGLDIRNVQVVVNYDAPNNCTEDYVHRIGRTGRAFDKGDAWTLLVSWGQEKQAGQIRKIMEKAGQTIPRNLLSLTGGGGGGGDSWGGSSKSWDDKKDDDWKKDDWKKDDWKKDDWKKDDWKKDKWEDKEPEPERDDIPGGLISGLLGKRSHDDDDYGGSSKRGRYDDDGN